MENSFSHLLSSYKEGGLTGEALEQFFLLLEKEENQALLAASIDETILEERQLPPENTVLTERAVQALREAMKTRKEAGSSTAPQTQAPLTPAPVYRMNKFRKWGWAAAVLLVLGGSLVYVELSRKNNIDTVHTDKLPKTDIPPGKEGAILTLADGKTLVLDSLHNGEIAAQNGATLLLADGHLAYRKDKAIPANGELSYNTMTTPKGRQYQVVLPDGTRVWLNAASSLTYPTAFTGKDRTVEITGEAYFEVAKNQNKPFIVKINRATEVEVLGTRFNVNAYVDEPAIHTTLLEGSVKVIAQKKAQLLTPGQQAQVNIASSTIRLIPEANLEQVLAWKNGFFSFSDADLETVMRQLARWYNVEVHYEGAIPKREFNGEIGAGLTLDQVLKILTKTRVNYKIEAGRITIYP